MNSPLTAYCKAELYYRLLADATLERTKQAYFMITQPPFYLNQVQVYYFLTVSFNLTVSSEELKNHILFRLKLTEEQHVKQIKFKTFVVYKNEWLVPLTHIQIN